MAEFLKMTFDASDIRKLSAPVKAGLFKGVTAGSAKLTSEVQNKHLRGGTSSSRLGVRSGRLRSETRALRTKLDGSRVEGGFKIGVFYASTHFGPKGKVTTIKPKSSRFLTIPLPPALTAGGRPKKKSAREWGDRLQFIPRRGKSPLLAEVTRGGIRPFYVLKTKINIKTRVHPEVIARENEELLARIIDNSIQTELNKL